MTENDKKVRSRRQQDAGKVSTDAIQLKLLRFRNKNIEHHYAGGERMKIW